MAQNIVRHRAWLAVIIGHDEILDTGAQKDLLELNRAALVPFTRGTGGHSRS